MWQKIFVSHNDLAKHSRTTWFTPLQYTELDKIGPLLKETVNFRK